MFSRFGSRVRGAKAAAATTEESAEAHFTRPKSYSPNVPFFGGEANELHLKHRTRPFDFHGNEAGYTGDVDNDYFRARYYVRPPLNFGRDGEVEGVGSRVGNAEPAATETEPTKYKHFWQDPKQRPKMLAATAASLLLSGFLVRWNTQNIDTAQNLNAAVQASHAQQQAAAQQAIAQNEALDVSASRRGTKLNRRDISSSINDERGVGDDSQTSQVHLVKRFNPFRAIRERLPDMSFSEGLTHIHEVAASMPSDVRNLVIKYTVGATAMIGTGFTFLFIYFRDRRHHRHHDPPSSPANYTEPSSPPSQPPVPPDQVVHTRLHKRSIDSSEAHVRSHEDGRLLAKEAAATVAHVKKRALGRSSGEDSNSRADLTSNGQLLKHNLGDARQRPRISKRMAPLDRTMEMSTVSAHGANPGFESERRLVATTRELMDEWGRWRVPLAVTTALATSGAFLGIGLHRVIKYLHEVQQDHNDHAEPDSKPSSSPSHKPPSRRHVLQGERPFDGSGFSTSGHHLSKRMIQMPQFAPILPPPIDVEGAMMPHLAAAQASHASSRVVPVEGNEPDAVPVDLPGQAAQAAEEWMPPEVIFGLTALGSVAIGTALAALAYVKLKGNDHAVSTRHVESTRSSSNAVEAEHGHEHERKLHKRGVADPEVEKVGEALQSVAQEGGREIAALADRFNAGPSSETLAPAQAAERLVGDPTARAAQRESFAPVTEGLDPTPAAAAAAAKRRGQVQPVDSARAAESLDSASAAAAAAARRRARVRGILRTLFNLGVIATALTVGAVILAVKETAYDALFDIDVNLNREHERKLKELMDQIRAERASQNIDAAKQQQHKKRHLTKRGELEAVENGAEAVAGKVNDIAQAGRNAIEGAAEHLEPAAASISQRPALAPPHRVPVLAPPQRAPTLAPQRYVPPRYDDDKPIMQLSGLTIFVAGVIAGFSIISLVLLSLRALETGIHAASYKPSRAEARKQVDREDWLSQHLDSHRRRSLSSDKLEERLQQELGKRGLGSYVSGKATDAWEAVKVAKDDFQSLGSKIPLSAEERQARNDRIKNYAIFAGHLVAAKVVESYVVYRVLQLHKEAKDEKAFQENARQWHQAAILQKRGIEPVAEGAFDAARQVTGTNPESRKLVSNLAYRLASPAAVFTYLGAASLLAAGALGREVACQIHPGKWPRFCGEVRHAVSNALPPPSGVHLSQRDGIAKREVQVSQVHEGSLSVAALVQLLRQVALGSHRAGIWNGVNGRTGGESRPRPLRPSRPRRRVGHIQMPLLFRYEEDRYIQALFAAHAARRWHAGWDNDGDGRLDKAP